MIPLIPKREIRKRGKGHVKHRHCEKIYMDVLLPNAYLPGLQNGRGDRRNCDAPRKRTMLQYRLSEDH